MIAVAIAAGRGGNTARRIVRSRTGSIQFNGADVTQRTTSHRIGQGMAIVPENRRLFAPMTVLEIVG